MLRLNEQTGEWYEDEYDQDQIPEPPSDVAELQSREPEHIPLIKGYGTRVVMDKVPGQWTTEWGAPASPEYVKDIDETINAVDTGRMSEADLSRKIARQEGLPSWGGVPAQPSDQQLSVYDQLSNAMEMMEPDFIKKATKDADDMLWEATGYATGLPKLPNEQKAWQRVYEESYNRNRTMHEKFFEKKIAADQERLRHQRNLTEKRYEASLKPTDIGLTIEALTAKLGRKPTAQEILDAKEQSGIRIASAKATATEKGKAAGQRGMLSEDTLEQAYQYVKSKGEFAPEIARLFRVPGAQLEVMDYVAKRTREEGGTGEERIVQGAIQKSLTSSLAFQEKQYGQLTGFTKNIEKQVDRTDEIMKDVISRVGVRALDLPIRELKTRFAGSGSERVLEAYLAEVSNEIAKISTGSQASIAELSVGAQERWNRIHDPNLSYAELKKILEETKKMAVMRLDSVGETIKETRTRFKTGTVSPAGRSGKPRLTPAEALEELRRRGKI